MYAPVFISHYDPTQGEWHQDGWFAEQRAQTDRGALVLTPRQSAYHWVVTLFGFGWWSAQTSSGALSYGRYGITPPLQDPNSGQSSQISVWNADGSESLWTGLELS